MRILKVPVTHSFQYFLPTWEPCYGVHLHRDFRTYRVTRFPSFSVTTSSQFRKASTLWSKTKTCPPRHYLYIFLVHVKCSPNSYSHYMLRVALVLWNWCFPELHPLALTARKALRWLTKTRLNANKSGVRDKLLQRKTLEADSHR